MRLAFIVIGLSFHLVFMPLGARGMPGSPAQIPSELAMVLVDAGDGTSSIFVGDLPPGMTERLPAPAGMEWLGGILRENGATVVLESQEPPARVLERYSEALLAAGWEFLPRSGFPEGGFEWSLTTNSTSWCNPEFHLRATAEERQGTTFLRLGYSSWEMGSSRCDPDVRAGFANLRRPHQPAVPRLAAPEGAEVRPLNGGGSSGLSNIAVLIRSQLPLERVFTHYAEQLVEAGWTSTRRSVAGDMALAHWSWENDEGERLQGMLSVTASPEPGIHVARILSYARLSWE